MGETARLNASFDITALRAALVPRAAEIATVLLGEPNYGLSNNRELRFGRKGSLAVVIAGAKAGWWYDHENGTGGDLVDLIRRQHGGGFVAAVEHAQRFSAHARTVQASSEASARCRMGTTDAAGNQRQGLGIVGGRITDRQDGRRSLPRDARDPRAWHRPRSPTVSPVVSFRRTGTTPVHARTTARHPHGRTARDPSHRIDIGRRQDRPHGARSKDGAAVKLSPDDAVTMGLTIAEGVETALSGIQLGWRPAWSVGDAAGIAKFPVLPGVEALTILVDNDESGTGQRRAIECSDRWTKAGREVLRVIPRRSGDDLNDMVCRAAVA